MYSEVKNIYDLPSYIDGRGRIQMILESCSIGSISRITSEGGSTRANHKHFEDTHWIEIIQGKIELYEQLNEKEKPTLTILRANDIAFTEAGVCHTMFFPFFTIFNCYSKLPRNQKNYEADTQRFNFSLKDVYEKWKD